MPRPSYSSWFDHSNESWCGICHKTPLLYSPLLYAVTSSSIGPNITLSVLFSNNLNLHSLLSVRDRIYCSCKNNKQTYCCILSFGWFPGVWILYADFRNTLFHLHNWCKRKSCLHYLWR
jgi:hypothetical protein